MTTVTFISLELATRGISPARARIPAACGACRSLVSTSRWPPGASHSGAAATVINLPEDAKGTTTIESKTNFIGSAKEGSTVIATATPVHRGRRTQVWQTRLETEDGKLVALVTQTQMVL